MTDKSRFTKEITASLKQARPDKNLKLLNMLMEVDNIKNDDNSKWSYFKFCGLNRNTIHFLFYHKVFGQKVTPKQFPSIVPTIPVTPDNQN